MRTTKVWPSLVEAGGTIGAAMVAQHFGWLAGSFVGAFVVMFAYTDGYARLSSAKKEN